MAHPLPTSDVRLRWLAVVLGVFSFGVTLAAYHITDADVWGKLAIGAYFWHFGTVPAHDILAFTPTLAHYIDHEWGSGTIFFWALKYFGPPGLMWLKIGLAFGAILAALAAGGRSGCRWETLLVLAIPAASCALLGYIPVLRSHAFTYCFFSVTLLALEDLRAGKKWPLLVLPPMFLVWSNVHGGFVAGLGAIAVYSGNALITRRHFLLLLGVAAACGAATLINIYGLKYWAYLVPALLNKRPHIVEWGPLPVFASDIFNPFRILFALVVFVALAGWRRVERKNWPGLLMLCITATLAWRSRRHAPFFGVTALAFAGPYLDALFLAAAARLPARLQHSFKPALGITLLYGLLAVFVAAIYLPGASLQPLAPVGHDPVREVDILSRARAEGNLATPFGWGSYCAWRLMPGIKISMDGRYEAAFPESTFELNSRFYGKQGTHWDDLIRDYTVDYVILEYLENSLRPADLTAAGYELIWENPGHSALLCLPRHAAELRRVAAALPPTTINPLDATIPDRWWPAMEISP